MNIIDFNDLMLTGYGPDGAIQHAAPALANVDDDGQLTFGEAALRRHRSQPQTSQSHYLARLTDAVFTPSIGQAQTQADLLYYQLAGLQQQQTTESGEFFLLYFYSGADMHTSSLLSRSCAFIAG